MATVHSVAKSQTGLKDLAGMYTAKERNPGNHHSSLPPLTFFPFPFLSLVAQMVKASACNVGDPGSIPGSGRSPGEGNGNPLQYSCLENSMDGGAWWATAHGVAKSRTRNNFTFTFHFFAKLCLTLTTPWTVARQAPLFMGFSRQENWSGLPFLLQGIFPTQGLNLHLLH